MPRSFCASHRDLIPESQAGMGLGITALIPARDPGLTDILLDPTSWLPFGGHSLL